MTTRIEREFSFQAGVYFKDSFAMNLYEFSVCMNVETDSIREQNVAMERIKYFVSEHLENSIFIEASEQKMIDKYVTCGFKVCTIPEEPYDQMIATMLLLKLNSIAEGRLEITDIALGTRLSDDVRFLFDCESDAGPFEREDWWTEPSVRMTSVPRTQNKKDKIVQLFKTTATDWHDLNLSWKEKSLSVSDRSEISFVPAETPDK
jgi:hypothetical protein